MTKLLVPAFYLALLSSLGAQAADVAPLKRNPTNCGSMAGLPLLREVDDASEISLQHWFKMLKVQADYVHKCQAITADMKQASPEWGAFKEARAKYLNEIAEYRRINKPRPPKIKKLVRLLKDGGETNCRRLVEEELSMLKNRESVLKDVNCRR